MLKRITLINFMAHRNTVIDLSRGLTVIAGENNCGKSAIVAAIQCVCNNASGDYMVRHGEKDCQVTIETDDDHTITWRRNRGSVSYEVDGEQIDRTNRKVPDKVRQVLKMSTVKAESDEFNVHFGEQKDPIFLLNGTPSQRAAFFASSSDAAKLIEMQSLHKQKVSDARKDLRDKESREAELLGKIEHLSPIDSLQEKLSKARVAKAEITKQQDRIQRMQTTITRLREQRSAVTALGRLATLLRQLPDSEPHYHSVALLEPCVKHIRESRTRVETETLRLRALAQLPSFPDLIPCDPLERLIRDIRNASSSITRLSIQCKQLTLPVLPRFHETARLEVLLKEYRTQAKRLDRLKREAAVMDSLALPDLSAKKEQLDQLGRTILRLNQQAAEVARLDSECRSWRTQAAQAHEAFHQALEDLGQCPTCGQPMQKSTEVAG